MTDDQSIPRGYDRAITPLPELVIFDLDDTLCDHERSLEIRLDYAFEPFIPDPKIRERAVQQAKSVRHFGTDHFDDILAEFGATADDVQEIVRERYASDRFRGLELHHDTLWALGVIANYTKIGLITNGPTDIQQPKIDMLDIEHHFAFVVISERAGYWKPDPRIFELGLERTGTAPERAVYIGDNPEADVEGARAAGIPAIWMNRAGRAWPGGQLPDLEVRSLEEFVVSLGLEEG